MYVTHVMPRFTSRTVRATLALILLASVGALAVAQRGRNRGVWIEDNVPYDGKFTFARLRYADYNGSGWWFDYPTMERNLMTMVPEVTALRAHFYGSNIHRMDDPELSKYPVSYLSEPGYWFPSESEIVGLRTYLQKGGFLIVDDFRFQEWVNFERQMLRVLPGANIVRLDVKHQVFDSFFRITSLEMQYPHSPHQPSSFWGIFEDNDPSKRLMVVINYDTDIGDYMEHSEQGLWPVNISNEAYKFMMNYLFYGLAF
jgi:hypothetical protein